MNNYEIWTDGAYKPTTDVGGAAIVVTKDSRVMYKISNRYEKVTNNIMEITAIIMALKFVDHKIDSLIIHTDSQYCLGIINKGWTRNKNQALWEMFDKTLRETTVHCKNIKFVFTKGHDKDPFNNLADELAVYASKCTAEQFGPGFRIEPGEAAQEAIESKVEAVKERPRQSPIIAIDFDGTVVTHEYPEIGSDIGAIPVLKALQQNGCKLILNTMRDSHSNGRNCLGEACAWLKSQGINLYSVNCNPTQKTWTDSPKLYAHLYIDDAALGIPLKGPANARKYVDWEKCVDLLDDWGLLYSNQVEILHEYFKNRNQNG